MPASFVLGPVDVVRPAFGDHLTRNEIDSQIRALVRANGAAVECGDTDAKDQAQDEQDAQPLPTENEFYEFLDEFHIFLVKSKAFRVRRGSPYSIRRTSFSIESNTPIGL